MTPQGVSKESIGLLLSLALLQLSMASCARQHEMAQVSIPGMKWTPSFGPKATRRKVEPALTILVTYDC